jgi:hypothetical protein
LHVSKKVQWNQVLRSVCRPSVDVTGWYRPDQTTRLLLDGVGLGARIHRPPGAMDLRLCGVSLAKGLLVDTEGRCGQAGDGWQGSRDDCRVCPCQIGPKGQGQPAADEVPSLGARREFPAPRLIEARAKVAHYVELPREDSQIPTDRLAGWAARGPASTLAARTAGRRAVSEAFTKNREALRRLALHNSGPRSPRTLTTVKDVTAFRSKMSRHP